MLEILRPQAPPNICEYHGCFVEEGYVAGIVFTAYLENLDGTSAPKVEVDHEMVMRDITSAIEHLHSLGIVHVSLHFTRIPYF